MIEKEKVQYTDDGLEAIIFTAQGDMRQVCAVSGTDPPGGRGERLLCTVSIGRVGSVDPTALLGPCAPCLQGGRSAKGPGRKITLYVFLFLDRH